VTIRQSPGPQEPYGGIGVEFGLGTERRSTNTPPSGCGRDGRVVAGQGEIYAVQHDADRLANGRGPAARLALGGALRGRRRNVVRARRYSQGRYLGEIALRGGWGLNVSDDRCLARSRG
jgi:hypothetical protein